MKDAIFLVRGETELLELKAEPYDSEDLLQGLLERFPGLLMTGASSSEAGRRLLLIEREASVPDQTEGGGRWSVDHLFVDEEGVPTLVEVKRSTDTRIRREVVGQMLDYAANAVSYWPVEGIRVAFEKTCSELEEDPEARLGAFLGSTEPDAFWLQVKTNLQAGRIRMLFVADEIPAELRRVVEFLNEQMDPAEVGAVEIRQFVGEGMRTLVPRQVGQTAGSERRKGAGRRETKEWNVVLFFEELGRTHPDDSPVAREIYQWAVKSMPRPWWGSGKQIGSFIPVLDHKGTGHTLIALWTSGVVAIQLGYMERRPPFDSEALREELVDRLNGIEGVQLPSGDLTGRFPSIHFSALRQQNRLGEFLGVLDWAVDQIKLS